MSFAVVQIPVHDAVSVNKVVDVLVVGTSLSLFADAILIVDRDIIDHVAIIGHVVAAVVKIAATNDDSCVAGSDSVVDDVHAGRIMPKVNGRGPDIVNQVVFHISRRADVNPLDVGASRSSNMVDHVPDHIIVDAIVIVIGADGGTACVVAGRRGCDMVNMIVLSGAVRTTDVKAMGGRRASSPIYFKAHDIGVISAIVPDVSGIVGQDFGFPSLFRLIKNSSGCGAAGRGLETSIIFACKNVHSGAGLR